MADIEYTKWVRYPDAQLRFEMDKEHGQPTRFVVQLERLVDGEWRAVVRFDHDQAGELSHDIREEGLHMDIYQDGEKALVRHDFPPVPLNIAAAYAQAHIEREADDLLRRFDQWHNLTT